MIESNTSNVYEFLCNQLVLGMKAAAVNDTKGREIATNNISAALELLQTESSRIFNEKQNRKGN